MSRAFLTSASLRVNNFEQASSVVSTHGKDEDEDEKGIRLGESLRASLKLIETRAISDNRLFRRQFRYASY